MQVQKAFEYVSKTEEVDVPDVRYEVTARRSDSAVSQRGILLRDPLESVKAVTHVCDVHPKLHEVSCILCAPLSEDLQSLLLLCNLWL